MTEVTSLLRMIMNIRELINELIKYDPNQEVEICCYTTVNNSETIIYDDIRDSNGNPMCQGCMKISYVGLETDKKTVCIS